MPFMTNGRRDYKKESNWEKTQARHRLSDRVKRIQARREVEKKTGNLPSDMHVDHKKELTKGGTNSKTNLRVVSARTNLSKEASRKKRQYR
jgi:5-methylcytosine-specific restriction endonuclease McrA